MLPFHRAMARQLVPSDLLDTPVDTLAEMATDDTQTDSDKEQCDGFLVAARGLSLQRIVLSRLIQAHATPKNLVLLINFSATETDALHRDLNRLPHFEAIANETPAATRKIKYQQGGVLSCTSRILVVDLLNRVVPLHLLTGVIVCHAHRISDSSTEAFILRLVREGNKVAFIRAFSENPEALTSSGVLWKLEKTMKQLFLRKVFFWPRFHMDVQESIDSVPPIAVRQVRVQMTKNMQDIQAALIDCINESILEIKRAHRFIDPDELSVENALFASFESLLKMQLDPVWHRVSPRTKQVVSDIGTLRRLLGYLTIYDSTSFLSFLESIQSSFAIDSLYQPLQNVSPWLLYDATDAVFSTAKKRVYKKLDNIQAATNSNRARFGSNLEPNVPEDVQVIAEELPKWAAVRDLVAEIEKSRTPDATGPILIMVHGDRTATQLSHILSGHKFTVSTPSPRRSANPKKRAHDDEEPLSSTATPQHPRQQQPQTRRRQRGTIATKTTVTVHQPNESPPSASAGAQSAEVLPEFSTPGACTLSTRQIQNYFRWKGAVHAVTAHAAARGGGGNRGSGGNSRGVGAAGGRGMVRRRVRGRGGSGSVAGGMHLAVESVAARVDTVVVRGDQDGYGRNDGPDDSGEATVREDGSGSNNRGTAPLSAPIDKTGDIRRQDPLAALDAAEFQANYGIVELGPSIVIRPYATSILSPSGGYMTNGDDDSRMLESLRPGFVIMYDVDTAFIRRLEVFHAQNGGTPKLSVYFMIYDNSIEEQKYLTSLRKEKDAFERLIREKANMAIPIDQDGRVVDPEDIFWRNLDTRVAGGQQLIPAEDANQVIVDVREFRSALPSLLHSRRMKLRPCTLEVGDYVLTPQICVERKSIPDLVGSFKSGRLFTQVEAMCLHYPIPVLLIEFTQGKSFSLGPAPNPGDTTANEDLQAKLALLAITFPKLRVMWSSSPSATAEMFEDLKKDQREPNVEEAAAVGVENAGETIDSAFAITPSDMVRALPGVTSKNYRNVMRRVECVAEIAGMSLEECRALVGEDAGRALHNFLYADVRKSVEKPK